MFGGWKEAARGCAVGRISEPISAELICGKLEDRGRPTVSDHVWLLLAAGVLLGFLPFGGKALTLHEARLPQCARDMLEAGEWLLPFSGHRPWLERPPFPHWWVMVSGMLAGGLGGAEKVWAARLPAAIAGTLTAILTMWSASRLVGRRLGLLSGVVLVSMWEFYFYAGQAEDDIFLALLVSAAYFFLIAERFPLAGAEGRAEDTKRLVRPWWSPVRSPAVVGFFIALGATAWAKGPGVGVIQICSCALAYAALSRDRGLWATYLYPMGFVLTSALVLTWPAYAYVHHPDVLENLKYDLNGPFGHEGFWYYGMWLLVTTQPWTFGLVIAVIVTRKRWMSDDRTRFVWCWALAPVIVASLPARKHHHYLVPMLPALAVMASVGVGAVGEWIRSRPVRRSDLALTMGLIGILPASGLMTAGVLGKLPGPVWAWAALPAGILTATAGYCLAVRRRSELGMMASIVFGLAVFLAYGQGVIAARNESARFDIAMLEEAKGRLEPGKTVYIIADNQLDFFRLQWYLREPSTVIQNATFLRDEKIKDPWVYVLTRDGRTKYLTAELGQLETVLQSPFSRKEKELGGKFTIYKLTFTPNLQRYPAPPVGVVQAMFRYDAAPAGPYCGPAPTDRDVASTRPATE